MLNHECWKRNQLICFSALSNTSPFPVGFCHSVPFPGACAFQGPLHCPPQATPYSGQQDPARTGESVFKGTLCLTSCKRRRPVMSRNSKATFQDMSFKDRDTCSFISTHRSHENLQSDVFCLQLLHQYTCVCLCGHALLADISLWPTLSHTKENVHMSPLHCCTQLFPTAANYSPKPCPQQRHITPYLNAHTTLIPTSLPTQRRSRP